MPIDLIDQVGTAPSVQNWASLLESVGIDTTALNRTMIIQLTAQIVIAQAKDDQRTIQRLIDKNKCETHHEVKIDECPF